MLGDAAAKDGFEIGEIGDVNDLIDAVHERAHRVVGSEPMTDQDNKVLAPLRVRTLRQFRQNGIGLQR